MKKSFQLLILTLLAAVMCCMPVFAASGLPGESTAASVSNFFGTAFAVINDADELWIHYENGSPKSKLLATDAKMVVSLYAKGVYVLKNDGSLLAYGFTHNDVEFIFRDPVRVLSGIEKIAGSGNYDFFALSKDGTLYKIDDGSLNGPGGVAAVDYGVTAVAGNLTTNIYYLKDDEVWKCSGQGQKLEKTLSFSDGAEIYVYEDTFYVLTEDGDLYSWGSNKRGQVGNGGAYDYQERRLIYVTPMPQSQDFSVSLFVTTPCKILEDVVEFWSSEAGAVYAVDADGDTWTWGYGENAMCYYDATTGSFGPTRFPDNKDGYSPVRTVTAEKVVSLGTHHLKFDQSGTVSHYFGYVDDADIKWSKLCNWKTGSTAVKPTTPAVTATAFSDVPRGMYCYDAVDWAVEENITAGTTKTTFSPARTCSQAEILTFLWRAAGSPKPWINDPYGLTAGTYYYDAMLWAYEEGVVTSRSLSPNDPCTRSDVVTYLWRLSGCPEFEASGVFTDVSSRANYAQAVDWAVAEGITSGTSATTFSPAKTCTRGEIVTFLYRYFA